MKKSNIDDIYDKIAELEKEKMAYLEANQKASANKIAKQIENLELELEFINLKSIKEELNIYKKVVLKYPSILCEVKRELTQYKGGIVWKD